MSALATFSDFVGSDLMASISREWSVTQRSKPAVLKEQYAEWLAAEQTLIETATKRIYESEEVAEIDLRYHLAALSAAIAEGEALILQAFRLREEGAVTDSFFAVEISALDERIARLLARLNQWHGTIDSQTDLPEELKQAFREATSGEVIPFPRD